jgi:hypothetical protein
MGQNLSDSTIRPIVPRGWVVLPNDGFRQVLSERVELMASKKIITLKDSTICLLKEDAKVKEAFFVTETNILKQAVKEGQNKLLSKKIELWLWRGIAFMMAITAIK